MSDHKLREAWPSTARQRSIEVRQRQATLRKVRFYLNTATPTSLATPDFSGRAGFRESPEKVAEAELAEVLRVVEQDERLEEVWSDAARAAAVAARRARGKGGDWRRAGRQAYVKAGGKTIGSGSGPRSFDKSVVKWVSRANLAGEGVSGRNVTGRTMGKFLRQQKVKLAKDRTSFAMVR